MRARMSYAAAAVSGVAAIAATVVGVRGVYGDQSAPVVPSHTAPRTTTPATTVGNPHRLTAEQIVDSPKAELRAFAVAPDDQDVRATGWELCTDHRCRQPADAVAVTADGYRHTAYVRAARADGVTWVGGDSFLVDTRQGPRLVGADGRVTALHVSSAAGPLRAGEMPATIGDPARPYAVSVARGTAHPISPPSGAGDVRWLNLSGRTLYGFAGARTFVSSPDGGVTWRQPLKLPRRWLYTTLDSGARNVLAIADVGDDGTLVMSTLRRSVDGGATWQVVRAPQLQRLVTDWAAVTPDDRLLVNVPKKGFQDALPSGLYESDDSTWQHFHRVAPASPHPSQYFAGWEVSAVTDSEGRQTLYAVDSTAYVSTDHGRTWQLTRVR